MIIDLTSRFLFLIAKSRWPISCED
ncbi:hypothetical protein MNBD_CHLOROFLEXI01-4141, partial [hydrothermal vent metagenome]